MESYLATLEAPKRDQATHLFAEGSLDSVRALLDLLDGLPGDGVERLAAWLTPRAEPAAWSNLLGLACIRQAMRLKARQPEAALEWLERALRQTEGRRTREESSLWCLAVLRREQIVPREATRLVAATMRLVAEAQKWAAPETAFNTLRLALLATRALADEGRREETLAVVDQAREIPWGEDERLALVDVLIEGGLALRHLERFDDAALRYAECRTLLASVPLRKASGVLSWLISEQIFVAWKRHDAAEMLALADAFEHELGTTPKVEPGEREYARAQRAHALLVLGRLEEVEPALQAVAKKPTPPPFVGSLVASVRARLFEAQGKPKEALAVALALVRTFGGEEKECKSDLDLAAELITRLGKQ